ncbi:cytochrome C [Caulobacter zeae]|uniref:Cytochrome C n=2 Tax=Caulobacter zeae TaxID=2055137 RepID=A0A2N5DRE0_9CAUL|nr:cytochrome C [Caulobacter zeae]
MRLALAMSVLGSLPACTLLDAPTAAERQRLGEIEAGRSLAKGRCLSCHQLDGPFADGAAPPFTLIAKRYRSHRLDWELQAIAEVGHYRMPPTLLSAAETSALAAYIQSLDDQARQQSPVTRRNWR